MIPPDILVTNSNNTKVGDMSVIEFKRMIFKFGEYK
jgi:hypothetical protein